MIPWRSMLGYCYRNGVSRAPCTTPITLFWLIRRFQVSAVPSWLFLRARYMVDLLFAQSVRRRHLRHLVFYLLHYHLMPRVSWILVQAANRTGSSLFRWRRSRLETCRSTVFQAGWCRSFFKKLKIDAYAVFIHTYVKHFCSGVFRLFVVHPSQ